VRKNNDPKKGRNIDEISHSERENREVICLPKIYWKKTIGVLACLALLCGLVAAIPAAQRAEAQDAKLFTILHTNDEHSNLIPFDPAIDYPDHPTSGGISRIAHELARIRAEKTAAGEPVLTLSAGDFSQGTLFSWLETEVNGHAELSLLDALEYDAVALGNHEFDMGAGYRAQALAQAKADGVKLPILCANIHFDDTYPEAAALHALYSDADLGGTQLAIQPYTVKTLSNGLKVGIFGMLGVEAENDAPAAEKTGVTFGDVERATVAQNMVNALRAQGCDVVVALSHSGTSEETELAAAVTGIDVIVGGHSHDLEYPPIMVGDTIIVQAGSYTNYLGELELEYAGGKVTVRNATAIRMDDSIPTDPGVDAALAAYKTRLDTLVSNELGEPVDVLAPFAETDLAGDGGFNINDSPPLVETNLGDLITDAFQLAATQAEPTKPVRIAVEANGVIRSGIPKGGTGQFSFYDLFRSFPLGMDLSGAETDPLGYPLVGFYLYGSELQLAMEGTLGLKSNTYFLQLAGARYSYYPAGPFFGKITSFEIDDMAGGWESLDPAALYKVTTCQYDAYFMDSFGLSPRDETGTVTTVDACIVYNGPDQVKGWKALAQYVGGMPDLDGDGIPNIAGEYRYPQMRITAAGWYLAEGSTAGGMETFVLVQNPGDAEVHVNVAFQTDAGEVRPEELQEVSIPANSRRTFKVNDWVTTYDVSTLVEPIDGEVICERAMYGNDRAWAHDSIGVAAPDGPAQEWYLAEGSTGGGMETWLLIQNPYASAVHVNIAFQTDTGEVAPADLQGVRIPAESRATFNVGSWVPDRYEVSTFVEAEDGMVVCERAMYGNGRAWAHDSIGATVLSDEWYLAEGSTEGGMDTWVLVQNPGDTAVNVDVTFNTGAGEVAPPALQGVYIPARSRRTFKVNAYVTTYDVSTYVKSTGGAVVVERAMYGGGGIWAHDSIGETSPANACFLAEGSTDGGMETFVLVQNPGETDAVVDIVFQTGTGEVAPDVLQDVPIPARSRRTFKVNDFVTTYDVSTAVLATEGQVIVERAMYGGGRTWAHDSIGYAMSVLFEAGL